MSAFPNILRRLLLVFFFVVPLTPLLHLKCVAAHGQATATPVLKALTGYPNTAEGLLGFLNDVLAASQEHDSKRALEMVRQTEIPNYREWFYKMYPPDKAESWIDPYGNELRANEESFQQLFARLTQSQGHIVTRKLSDSPGGDRGLEWALLHSAKELLDIYFAGWVSPGTDDRHADPIGYFIFIDGMFRWDSLLHVAHPVIVRNSGNAISKPESPLSGPAYKPGGDVNPPKVISRVYPEYGKKSRKKGVQGTVLLSVVVDVDGEPKEITVVRSLDEELDQAAIRAVRQWRFGPGTKDGHPVPVQITVELAFHLA